MFIKNKNNTAYLLAALMMVAPATAYTNLNASDINKPTGLASAQAVRQNSVWFSDAGISENTKILVSAISDAAAHGLNPNSYGLNSLEQELGSFVTKSENSGSYISDSNAQERKQLEKQLYSALAKLSKDLGKGVLDAQKTQRNLFRAPPTVNIEELTGRLNSGETTVSKLLEELTPTTPHYTKLVEHMRVLLNERDTGVFRTPVRYVEGLALGSEHESIIDLRTRLKETGDLDEYAPLNLYFGDDLDQALKAVQGRHGLTETGELTEATVVALNRTIDSDIKQVAMNLERWRWMPRELGYRHIMINVPAYKLSMINGDQEIVDMPVVVGSKKHQTPSFSQGAQFVEVAPTWTVPASITNNELIPTELKNPGYLESERMDFLKWVNGRLVKVPRSQVTASDFHKKPFPYILRQRAGADNALGNIKILMPNQYAIYMHDTQAKSLFAKTDRAYSHGCIRLSDPFRLGSLLLQLDGKSQDETDNILSKTKTTRVELNEQTPTHISYFTAWVGDDGKLHQRKDVYKHNKPLLAGLNEKQTLISTLQNRPISVLAEQTDL